GLGRVHAGVPGVPGLAGEHPRHHRLGQAAAGGARLPARAGGAGGLPDRDREHRSRPRRQHRAARSLGMNVRDLRPGPAGGDGVAAQDDAYELLRQSEERFRLMVESVRDYAIFMLDADGYVTSWNRGAELNTGYRSEEIIGRHFSVFYPQD